MKKTIQKQLIRRSIIAVLVIAGIVLVGLEKKATFATETKEAADDQQSMETEKLYLTESSEETSNTNVDISVIEEAVYSDNDIPDSYEFEKPLSDTDTFKLFEDKSKEISAVINDKDKRTVTITNRESTLLDDLANVCMQSYISKEMPDLNRLYDLSNSMRQENRLLTEVYFYEKALVKANKVASFDYSVDIADVKPLSDNVDEIIFYLRKSLHTDEGDEDGGTWFIIRAAASSEGYKILDLWAQDYEYEMIQNRMKTDYIEKNIPLDRERLQKETKERIEEAMKEAETKAPFDDESEPSDKAANEENPTRRTTISYDRTAVGAAAKKYAKNYNPLFVAQDLDCTNYVSQCMWQSPGWPFDRIGNSSAVKWSCKKNSAGKYTYETYSWISVNDLWTYFQKNDSPSQAGTVYGISATTSGYNYSNAQVGDVIQFHNGSMWRHSVIVSEIVNGQRRCAAHTDDYAARLLSEYLAIYSNYRVAHINNFITSY